MSKKANAKPTSMKTKHNTQNIHLRFVQTHYLDQASFEEIRDGAPWTDQ